MPTDTDVSPAMYHHLRYNHFPPVDLSWAPVAEQAIAAAEAGDWDAVLAIGLNGRELTVRLVVEELHLDGFIDWEED